MTEQDEARAALVEAVKVILGPDMWPYAAPEIDRAVPALAARFRTAREKGRAEAIRLLMPRLPEPPA